MDNSWVQMVIQLGSFGVIAVFMVGYLPKMAQRVIDFIETTSTSFKQGLNDMSTVFKNEVEAVRTRADDRTDKVVIAIGKLNADYAAQLNRIEIKLDGIMMAVRGVDKKVEVVSKKQEQSNGG